MSMVDRDHRPDAPRPPRRYPSPRLRQLSPFQASELDQSDDSTCGQADMTELKHPRPSGPGTRLPTLAPDLDPYGDGVAPDPHDFYRPFQAPVLARDSIALVDQAGTAAVPDHAMDRPPRTANALLSAVRSPGARYPYPSSTGDQETSRVPPTSSDSTRPEAAWPPSSRPRQSSLRDLVHRFNQNTDESLPVPSAFHRPHRSDVGGARPLSPAMRSSKSSGPSGLRLTARSDPTEMMKKKKEQERAEAKDRRDPSSKKVTWTGSLANGAHRTVALNSTAATPPPSPRSERSKVAPANNPWASHSMTTLHLAHNEAARRPLFGEMVSHGAAAPDAGFGIADIQRKASEGSLRPSMAHRRARSHLDVSPSSPTAWYLGASPSLADFRTSDDGSPVVRPPHRRAKSDFVRNASVPTISPVLERHSTFSSMGSVDVNGPPDGQPVSPSGPRSRIPLSSRRQSTPSENGAPPVVLQADSNSTSSSREDRNITKGQGTASKSGGKLANMAPASPRTPTRSRPHHHPFDLPDGSQPPTNASPRLKAYISASLPKKSPPLRSSRPRLPVSSATTSASRAKMVSRYGEHQQTERGPSEPRRDGTEVKSRPRNIPELEAVDFAARRERIQRAFTKSVKERGLKDEVKVERREKGPGVNIALSSSAGIGREVKDGWGESQPVKDVDQSARMQDDDLDHQERSMMDTDYVLLGQNHHHGYEGHSVSQVEDQLQHFRLSFEEDILDPHSDPASPGPPDEETPEAFIPSLDFPHHDAKFTSILDQIPATKADRPRTPLETDSPVQSLSMSRTTTPGKKKVASPAKGLQGPNPLSPSPVFRRNNSGSDGADNESIQIMLELSPPADGTIPGGDSNPPDDEAEAPITLSEPETVRMAESTPTPSPARRPQSTRKPSAILTLHHDGNFPFIHGGNEEGVQNDHGSWSAHTVQTPTTGTSTIDSSTYSAINRILDQYHEADRAGIESFKDFQQRLWTESPELARSAGWDSSRVTQLYLQELSRGAYQSHVQGPTPPASRSKPEERKHEQDHAEANMSVTDAESNSSGLEVGGERPSYELSNAAWSSAGPSLEVEEDSRPMHRASLQSKGDWEDASPSIMDWIQPQAEGVQESETRFGDGPTPPPKEPLSSLKPRQSAETCLRSSRTSLEREGASTPRLPLDDRPQLPEIRSDEEGLGLAIDVEELGRLSSLGPPPLPDYAPPPPPALATENEAQFIPGPDRGLPSPPSPSVYSRNPPSSIFPATYTDDFRGQSSPVRASDVSTQPQHIFTPSAPHTQSSSSSHSRDTTNVERPPGHAPEANSTVPSSSPQQTRLTKRRNLIKELVDTESTFHRDMNITVEIYKATTEDRSLMSADDVKVLFGNIDQVVAFSQTFFDVLRQAASSVYVAPKLMHRRASASTATSSGTEDRFSMNGADITDDARDRRTFIGEAFGQHLSRMEKVYGDYLKNHDAANKRLEKLMPDRKIALWLEMCKSAAQDITNAWSLDSLLVKPVQRLLKYHLMLTELVEQTPDDHPDFTALLVALREMKAASQRINDMKKRLDVVEKVVGRKRKESDVRSGLSKAFGRRTEKLRQQVGLSEMVEDRKFNLLAEQWDHHFIQLQFAMRDVEGYLNDVHTFVDRFHELIQAIESFMDVAQSTHSELESKWRKFGIAMRELSAVALTEHKIAVEMSVVEPMKTLIRMYDGPQKIVQKRNKRIIDYARFRAMKARNEKPDKRTQEQSEQFEALNDTLKEELPRLYFLSGKLAEACLSNFIELQILWQTTWQFKLKSILDEHQVSESLAEIVGSFSGDFGFEKDKVLDLGICNGSVLGEVSHFLSPQTTRTGTGTDGASSQRPSLTSTRSRAISFNSSTSPVSSHHQHHPPPPPPVFSPSYTSGFARSPTVESPLSRPRHLPFGNTPPSRADRTRAGSTISNPGARSPEIITPSSTTRSFSAVNPGSTATGHNEVPRLALNTTTRNVDMSNAAIRRSIESPSTTTSPASASNYFNYSAQELQRAISPSTRPFSGIFSSAMPMSDSPRTSRPASPSLGSTAGGRERDARGSMTSPLTIPRALFAVASREEFNVDRSKMEAGYPYLTYVSGEIFDVVAEKGELWLAINQDDQGHQVGWIWSRHFSKLVDDSL